MMKKINRIIADMATVAPTTAPAIQARLIGADDSVLKSVLDGVLVLETVLEVPLVALAEEPTQRQDTDSEWHK